jgi:hypothetical protein
MTPRADRPPSRRALASAGLVVVGCLGLFVLIAEDVLDGGGLISRDEAALSWFVDHRTDPLITAARWVSTLGGFIALCVIGIALGLLLGSRRTPVLLAAAPMASLLLGGLASLAAKELFGRDRPPITLRATTVGLASFLRSRVLHRRCPHPRTHQCPGTVGEAGPPGGRCSPRRAGRGQPPRARRALALRRHRRLGPRHSGRRHSRDARLVRHHPHRITANRPTGRADLAQP